MRLCRQDAGAKIVHIRYLARLNRSCPEQFGPESFMSVLPIGGASCLTLRRQCVAFAGATERRRPLLWLLTNRGLPYFCHLERGESQRLPHMRHCGCKLANSRNKKGQIRPQAAAQRFGLDATYLERSERSREAFSGCVMSSGAAVRPRSRDIWSQLR